MAGMPHRLRQALDACDDVDCRMLTLASGFFFPADVVNPTWGECQRMIAEADVVHVHGLSTYGLFQAELRHKPFLVHIHGVPDRGLSFCPDFPHVVATPDLMEDYPQALFLPNLVLNQELPPSAPLGDGPLRVFKSPSLHPKNSDVFEVFMGPIIRHLAPQVQYVAPRRVMPHAELVKLRASCQISLDHLQGYYGLESLEALAQGMVAVNGASRQTMDRLSAVLGCPPPFAVAREPAQVGQLLLRLAQEALGDPRLLERRRQQGRRFMTEHYPSERLVRWWRHLYEATLGLHVWPEGAEDLASADLRMAG